MNEEKYLDVKIVEGEGSYADTANYDVVKLMMKADVVTVRGKSLRVETIEVNEQGVVTFHGKYL
ncbi:hypothetical protein GI584_14335 [Gracilibacillus salitolerans]|uniref:Uncharacterized protein n=1 Tax=Gracilibacillus salitolerans TaxID=2663022 RepID=A0A5Q2TMR8_9BACI|nr:hypothetical protein [Gracilibacillus salitolerans]QGH35150.1 hypothetical protein GI584_14335 [Gracilibacillus salitolerans]